MRIYHSYNIRIYTYHTKLQIFGLLYMKYNISVWERERKLFLENDEVDEKK